MLYTELLKKLKSFHLKRSYSRDSVQLPAGWVVIAENPVAAIVKDDTSIVIEEEWSLLRFGMEAAPNARHVRQIWSERRIEAYGSKFQSGLANTSIRSGLV